MVWCEQTAEWRLKVNYHGLNEVIPLLSAAVSDMSELHYELESKETKWCTPTDSATVLFLDPFGSRVQTMIWFPLEECPVHLKHSPTICRLPWNRVKHHNTCTMLTSLRGNTSEIFEEGKKIVLPKAGFAIKQS